MRERSGGEVTNRSRRTVKGKGREAEGGKWNDTMENREVRRYDGLCVVIFTLLNKSRTLKFTEQENAAYDEHTYKEI